MKGLLQTELSALSQIPLACNSSSDKPTNLTHLAKCELKIAVLELTPFELK